jgi:hypothetical protein
MAISIYGMGTDPKKEGDRVSTRGSGWYMVPICDSPISVYPEENKVEYKGHSLPKIEYSLGQHSLGLSADTSIDAIVKNGANHVHLMSQWPLYILIIIMCILIYFLFRLRKV